MEEALDRARGAIVVLKAAIKDDRGRPRVSTVKHNLEVLGKALGDAFTALSALDHRSRESLYRSVGEYADPALPSRESRRPLSVAPIKGYNASVDVDGVPTTVKFNANVVRGRGAVMRFAAACADAIKWVEIAVQSQPEQDRGSERTPGLQDFANEIAQIWEETTGQIFAGSPKYRATAATRFLNAMLNVAGVSIPEETQKGIITAATAAMKARRQNVDEK